MRIHGIKPAESAEVSFSEEEIKLILGALAFRRLGLQPSSQNADIETALLNDEKGDLVCVVRISNIRFE